MSDKQVKAIALGRVSTKGQLLDGNLEPQKKRIISAAEILDVDIVRWWELAVSSRKGKNVKRKDLLEMISYCKTHRSVKYLIVDEVDRFMRSIGEYYWWKQEFQNIGVQLRHANRPDVDPTEDRAVFDELIDVYRAESSNNERIHKTPDKMMAKIRAGYFPSNPHTGYKKSDIPGLHIPDDPNWTAMRDTFREMVKGECDVKEGHKRVLQRGLRTKNYGPKSVGGKKIDMFRWRTLMKDPYYCGVVRMADWPVTNDNGLHQIMVTKEEHIKLVELADNKGKRFIVNRNNPMVPLSNVMECHECKLANAKYPIFVGYPHNNGKHSRRNPETTKYYYRYRCRNCNKGMTRDVMHDELSIVLNSLVLTEQQRQKLKEHIKRMWTTYEKVFIEKSIIASGHVENLKSKKGQLITSLAQNIDLAEDIKPEIEKIKKQIEDAEIVAVNARDFERDLVEFTNFALDFVDNWKNSWWSLDKSTMIKCKQIVFPAGFEITQDKKVYTPEISPVYTYGSTKKAPEGASFTELEGPVGLEPTTRGLKGLCSTN